jgi:hypothetical protein
MLWAAKKAAPGCAPLAVDGHKMGLPSQFPQEVCAHCCARPPRCARAARTHQQATPQHGHGRSQQVIPRRPRKLRLLRLRRRQPGRRRRHERSRSRRRPLASRLRPRRRRRLTAGAGRAVAPRSAASLHAARQRAAGARACRWPRRLRVARARRRVLKPLQPRATALSVRVACAHAAGVSARARGTGHAQPRGGAARRGGGAAERSARAVFPPRQPLFCSKHTRDCLRSVLRSRQRVSLPVTCAAGRQRRWRAPAAVPRCTAPRRVHAGSTRAARLPSGRVGGASWRAARRGSGTRPKRCSQGRRVTQDAGEPSRACAPTQGPERHPHFSVTHTRVHACSSRLPSRRLTCNAHGASP